MNEVLAPLLTERDDADAPEGGIDPLGLYLIADSLGVRLVPGIRERQLHPRFVTMLAVSLNLCRDFDEEAVASDGVTEPWLVFEWYLVEGLVRTAEAGQTIGLPGSNKASRARDDRVPLSNSRYLKTPAIFGFHGVYRLLARTLGIEAGGRLADAGFELLQIWSKEQGLDGFVGTATGKGTTLRQQWLNAIQNGLEKGSTTRGTEWPGWSAFSTHLGLYNAGPKELRHLTSMLLRDESGYRRQVFEFLISAEGRQCWESTASERRFHEALRVNASPDLQQLLDAIFSYEQFARLCQDAFDDALCEMTRRGRKTSPRELGTLSSVKEACRQIPETFGIIAARLEPFGQSVRFHELYDDLAVRCSPAEWVERLASHHHKVQRLKPPDGKNPWFERFDDGSYVIRPLYRRDKPGQHDDSYAHAYRTASVWSFASDLHLTGT